MTATLCISISLILQMATSCIAWVVFIRSMQRWGWGTLAFAMTLMSVRRAVSLYGGVVSDATLAVGPELIALLISTVMLAGVIAVARSFDRLTLAFGDASGEVTGVRTYMASLPVGVVRLDAEGVCEEASALAASLIGQPAEKIVGQPLASLCDTAHADDVRHMLATVQQQFSFEGELTFPAAATTRPVALSASRLPRKRCICFLRDLTRERQAEGVASLTAERFSAYRDDAEAKLEQSRSRFRETLAAVDEGIFELALPTHAMKFTAQVYALLGYAAYELPETLSTWRQWLHADDRDWTVNRLIAPEGRDEALTFECRALSKTGSAVWLQVRARCIERDADGAATRILGIIADVTRRRMAERRLQEREDRLSLVMEGARLAAWDLNMHTGDLVVDDRWVTMLGYPPEERPWHNDEAVAMIHPADRSRVMAQLDDHIEGRTSHVRVEHRMRCLDGSYKWVLTLGRIVERDDDGNPLRAVGVNMDISERKSAEQALQDQLGESTDAPSGPAQACPPALPVPSSPSAWPAKQMRECLAAMLMNSQAVKRMLFAGAPDLDGIREAMDDLIADEHRAHDLLVQVDGRSA